MRNVLKTPFLRQVLQVRFHTDVDPLSQPADAAGKVVVMVGAVGETVHLGPVFANPTLHGSGFLKRFQTSINGYEIAGIRLQNLVGFIGGQGAFRPGQGPQDGAPLLGYPQARRTQTRQGIVEEMAVGVTAHESNLTKALACVTCKEQCMVGKLDEG